MNEVHRVQIGQKPLPVYKEKVFVMLKTVIFDVKLC